MDKLYVIKIGGHVIDDPGRLHVFLQRFSKVEGKKILVHGGGKLATRLAEQLGVPQQLVEGRRVTDSKTLEIVTMVYAGKINKEIVAKLQAAGCASLGLCGADGNLIRAHKRSTSIDYGYVGDIDEVNHALAKDLLSFNDTLVIAPLTHDGSGQLLNTNADTIAQALARAMSVVYETTLIYCFEKAGVLKDVNDENSVVSVITPVSYSVLRSERNNGFPVISEGMIPKLENALSAIEAGVKQVIIGKAEALDDLVGGTSGTRIQHAHS